MSNTTKAITTPVEALQAIVNEFELNAELDITGDREAGYRAGLKAAHDIAQQGLAGHADTPPDPRIIAVLMETLRSAKEGFTNLAAQHDSNWLGHIMYLDQINYAILKAEQSRPPLAVSPTEGEKA